jgi:acetylornithine deacetylase/succinyl-diaminopimelate desuccinylase-like protein
LGDNAVVKMAEAIKKLAGYQPKIILIPEVRQLIQTIAELEGYDTKVSAENLDHTLQGLGDRTLAEYLRAITRMTVSPNAVHGGAKTNIVPDSCEADIDIRTLPGQDKQYVFEELDELIGDVEMDIPDYNAPSFSGQDSRYYQLISDVTEEVMGDVTVLPCMSSGATDSRFLRSAGIPSYGIGMMAKNLDPGMRLSVHGRDERIDIESLRLKSDFLVRLARKYLGE